MNTTQQVFDYVVSHLITQGKQSVIDTSTYDGCAYRGNGGTSCAVGCLIPESEYHSNLESLSVEDILDEDLVPTLKKLSNIPSMSKLLSDLQRFHDDPDNWSETSSLSPAGFEYLFEVAADHGLKLNIS